MSEDAYIFTAINRKWGGSYDGIHDLDCAHDPKVTSKFSSVGVLIFWFLWYHPYYFNVMRPTDGFDYACC